MSAKVLITGFEPFGGDKENPSEQIVRRLGGRGIAGKQVMGLVLPVIFGESWERLRVVLDAEEPEVVICLGLASNRNCLSLERVAINVDDARIPDNRNQQPVDEAIEPDGPAAYWTRIPIKAVRERLLASGVAAEISQTAGTYVCNHVFYSLMHWLDTRKHLRGGFVHVPKIGELFDLDRLVAAVELIVETTLSVHEDERASGGSIS